MQATAAICVLVALAVPRAAEAKGPAAKEFLVKVSIRPGGTLDVTETIVFEFDSRTDQITREIRAGRNDGVEVREARMDGRALEFGRARGQVDVSGTSRVRVRWRFDAVSRSTHRFDLVYTVRGAVPQSDRADVVTWRAPGGEHAWPIALAAIDVRLPDGAPADLEVSARRAGRIDREQGSDRVRVVARDIRQNGWVEATVRLPSSAVVTAAPSWQQRQRRAEAMSRNWMAAAGAILCAGLMLFFGVRQSFDPPPRDLPGAPADHTLPDSLPPAMAGALVANGAVSLEQAMATLFALAERGAVCAEQHARGAFGTRAFTLTRSPDHGALSAFERAAVDVAFAGDERTVALSKARTRLVRRLGRFKRALHEELGRAGLFDEERRALRRTLARVAAGWAIAATIAVLPAAWLMREYGGWPMLVPAAFAALSLVGVIVRAGLTPLSNDGVRRAHRWRALRSGLKAIKADDRPDPAWLPFAIALGQAGAWSRQARRGHTPDPAWFRAPEDPAAFAAFVATAGAGVQRHAH